MRHSNRIIRRLRKEREHLIQENKQHELLLTNVKDYVGESTPSAALAYVRYIELCNNNQKEEINALNRKNNDLRMQLVVKEQDHVVDVFILAVLGVILFGILAYNYFMP